MDDGRQLDLFGWDRVKVGEGFGALGRLDLPRAFAIFEEALSRWPGHPGASAGLAMAAAWDDALRETERLQTREAAATLWERIKSYPFGPWGQAFREGLIQRVIGLLEGDSHLYVPPDLCLGRLLLELEDHGRAEEALRGLLGRHPLGARLLVCLGNCLFRQGRTGEARVVYAKALLAAPWEVEPEGIEDKELSGAIADQDVYSGAVWGWLRGVLPLVDVEVGSPHDEKHEGSLQVYQTVRRAEQARANGAHGEMVDQRRLLRQLAPAVFLAYMGRLS
ncbi:MAG: tetratricopeptide repeat protein [Candidatus Methylomirabilota bacterium]|jgi:tetratricopeptide (TPR) repeat protein